MFIYICKERNNDKTDFIMSVALGPCYFSQSTINKIDISDLSLKIALDNCLIDKNKSDEFKTRIITLINKSNYKDNTNGLKLLNENIHALHRIYLSEEYNKRLDEILNIEKIIFDLMKNINFKNEYFQELNGKVIDYIRTH